MVRLFRGVRPRGLMPGPPPHPYQPDFDYHRGGMRGLPPRPGPPPHPRHIPPPHSRLPPPHPHIPPPYPHLPPPHPHLPPPYPPRMMPPPPHQPFTPRDGHIPVPSVSLPIPPPLGLTPPMRPPIPHPPFRRPIPPNPTLIRGRGGIVHRGVKRLGGAQNGRRKSNKRKEISEEMEVNKPWVTEALKAAIHKKFELFKTAKETKKEDDWRAYKEQRAVVSEKKQIAKLEYIGSHPDAGAFYCEMCDRGWKTQEKLAEHIAEHQVCGRDGCTFTAHPKIIQTHVQAQHDSGLYHRIVTAQSPDDVAKWIADRKSRFPTKNNLEKKEAQRQEMVKRGERITNQNKPFANRGEASSRNERQLNRKDTPVNKREHLPKNKQKPYIRKKEEDKTNWRDPNAWRGNLPQFPGTSAFPIVEEAVVEDSKTEECQSDDELWDKKSPELVKVTPKPLFSSVLASLMANYASDTSDEDEGDDDNNKKEPALPNSISSGHSVEEKRESCQGTDNQKLTNGSVPNNIDIDNSNKLTINEDDSDSEPDECVVDREDKTNVPLLVTKNEQMATNKPRPSHTNHTGTRPRHQSQQQFRRRQLSLLEKLLSNEIRHERNVILQCVHYVVKNNFLGSGNIGSGSSSLLSNN